MSWDRWNSGRDMHRQAAEFLRTGQTDYNPYVRNASVQGCTDSDQCGSGFACVGGNCIFIDSSAGGGDGSGSTAGCGGEVVPPGPGTGPRPPQQCEAGPGGNNDNSGSSASSVSSSITSGLGARRSTSCTKTGCGSGSLLPGGGGGGGGGNGDDCCGKERCCRFGAGYVQCQCGPCPPRKGCNQYCTNHYQTFGGHADGCSDDNTCDECDSCVSSPTGGQCEPKSSAPCWCDQEDAGCGEQCQRCGEDGDCEFDASTCMDCLTVHNFTCPNCPIQLGSRTCCYQYGDVNGYNNCRQKLYDECDEACDKEPPENSCDGVCNDKTYCGTPPPCPPKHTCSTVESGGNCIIRRECDKSNVPPECEPCDCSCHDDCPNCQICNASTGKCQPDPACEPEGGVQFRTATVESGSIQLCNWQHDPSTRCIDYENDPVYSGWSTCYPAGSSVVTKTIGTAKAGEDWWWNYSSCNTPTAFTAPVLPIYQNFVIKPDGSEVELGNAWQDFRSDTHFFSGCGSAFYMMNFDVSVEGRACS